MAVSASEMPAAVPFPPTNLKLLHLASGDLWAGAEVQLYFLLKALNQWPGVELQVVLLNEGLLAERLRGLGLAVTVFPESQLGFMAIARALRALLADNPPQIIHSHRLKENLLAAWARPKAAWGESKKASMALVRTEHGRQEIPSGWRHLKNWLLLSAEAWVRKHRTARVISVTAELTAFLQPHCTDRQLVTIDNGIDLAWLKACAEKPLSTAPPWRPGRLKVAMVCRLVPVKRLDLLIAIAAELKALGDQRFAFYVLGDGPLRAELEARIDAEGLADWIRLLGFVENPAAYMAQLDGLLILSDHEGLPMNLLEACALKIPVISHAAGGMLEVLADGGTLVKGQTPGDYVQVLQRLAEDPEHFQHNAEKKYNHLTANYAIDVIAERYLRLYQSVLGEGR